jgi:hypothetical protein
LEWFGEKHGRSLLDVAIADLAAMPAVASVMPGRPNRYEPMPPPVNGDYCRTARKTSIDVHLS